MPVAVSSNMLSTEEILRTAIAEHDAHGATPVDGTTVMAQAYSALDSPGNVSQWWYNQMLTTLV